MRNGSSERMALGKKSTLLAALLLAGTAFFSALYRKSACEVLLTLAITFGTISYHAVMRLLVGVLFRVVMQNRADYKKHWYRVGRREMAVYEKLNVKSWKRRLSTFDRTLFDPRLHTWDEIAQTMCQAELVHETIVLLSFLPIAAGVWFGAYPVFIATSVFAAGCDLLFVMMQRYNRQRISKLLERESLQKQSCAEK